ISNVVTDSVSCVVDMFHCIDNAFADTLNNFWIVCNAFFFFFKQKTAYEIGLGIPAEPLFRSDDRLEAFYDNPNALRDYFRDIGRMVLAAEGRKANDSHADCYQYFCVPEYGTANGRLHFHAVHFMRTLPTGSVDPNF